MAKELVGSGLANPTATMLSTAMMLRHLTLHSFATRLEDAVLKVYAEGNKALLTPDVGGTGTREKLTEAVIKHLN